MKLILIAVNSIEQPVSVQRDLKQVFSFIGLNVDRQRNNTARVKNSILVSSLRKGHNIVKYNANYGELSHPGAAFFDGELNIIKCQFAHTQLYIIKTVVNASLPSCNRDRRRSYMKEFEEYLRRIGKSENTALTYCRNIRMYFSWCRDSFGSEPKELYRSNVLEYISYMRNIRGYSPKSVNNHLSALRCLNKYLVQSGRQSGMAVLDSDFMKVQIQYASPCSVDKKEVEAFRQRMLESGSKRDFAIVTLLVYAGLRRSECVDLKLDQVDLVAKEIRVIGKGDKQRLVYINDRIAAAIREYLKERNADSPYLFASRQCAKLSASRINQIFNKYSDTITPKTLRHFFCSNALENGYSIHEVANQAGHSNVQTTLIYSNPSAKQMKEKANKL